MCYMGMLAHKIFENYQQMFIIFFLSPLERRACFLILIHLSFWVFFHLMMLCGFREEVENVQCFPKLKLAMLNNWFDAYIMTVNFTARV